MSTTTFDGATAASPLSDPLDEASTWLRMAVAVPYDSRDPTAWIREFQLCVASARRVLAARGMALRDESGFPPRLRALAGREADAHEQVTRMSDDLFTDAYLATQPDLLDMVDLVEAAKELEQALEGLRERRSDLLFEATYRDLGGGG
ncbi:MAG: hypothetical protein ACRDHF_05440 [Tepidiformaceae bacterium]